MADPQLGQLLSAGFALLFFVVLVRIVQRFALRYVEDRGTRHRARKAISFVGYGAAVFAVALVFSDRLGRLTVVIGVAGAGIAFALQEVIASVAGWIAISFGGFYKTGDRVQLGGIKGDVIDIGLLRTTLVEVGQWVNGDLYNGRVVRVANSFIFKEPVVNYSGDFPFLWDEVTVPVRLDSDLERAQALLEEVTQSVVGSDEIRAADTWKELQKKYPVEDAKTAPVVTMAFDENWVTFTIRYTVRFDRRRSTKHALFGAILAELRKSGGAVEVAGASLEVRSVA